jgi:predicted DNA-binding transcriptional regulator YafY
MVLVSARKLLKLTAYIAMAKEVFFIRYLLIIQRLRKSCASFEQVRSYLERESEIRGYNLLLEKRTFQREMNQIREQFGIDIRYDRNNRTYYIAEESSIDKEQNDRLLEGYEILELLKTRESHAPYIQFEQRKAGGLEYFYGLLHAIKNRKIIRVQYHKFYEEGSTQRDLHPLALKEANGRWYLTARDTKDQRIKTFGLDRIEDLEITREGFKNTEATEDLFKDSFGIIIHPGKPKRVVLSFNSFQGKYIKSYPLHHSQKVIKDDKKELLIELYIHITEDFIMELLSYGDKVKVVSPKSLISQMVRQYKSALGMY